MNNMQAVQKLNERELELGISAEASWHAKYRDSAWVYVGGLATELTEGDIICVLSQWGEVEDFNYPRDKKTGKPRGWCWCKYRPRRPRREQVAATPRPRRGSSVDGSRDAAATTWMVRGDGLGRRYEDQRSTILAVDNMNGAKLLRRTLRVDHCEKYKLPPELRDKEEAAEDHYGPAPTSKFAPGAAYVGKDLASSATLDRGVDVYPRPSETKQHPWLRYVLQEDASSVSSGSRPRRGVPRGYSEGRSTLRAVSGGRRCRCKNQRRRSSSRRMRSSRRRGCRLGSRPVVVRTPDEQVDRPVVVRMSMWIVRSS